MKPGQRQGPLRCAIYTRKSSEEGLDQEFNSLDAQRVSCEAYVLSQAGEGWIALPNRYDDGGFSGGNMDRPGLRRLLDDVSARRIDVVVVYKVDRLTRSLMDFAKIVEQFDGHEVSFVSVTQAFNTTSSMGRLTLNVLLSFAQFEREVTGERIRDKIALSKARGIWMGGVVPLGYDLADRHLTVSAAEADTVRLIFNRYLQLRSVNLLRDWLEVNGVRSKAWATRAGREIGGMPLSRGAIFHILTNRLYRGEIEHKGQIYPGRHAAIIEAGLFGQVRDRLSENSSNFRSRPLRSASAILVGRVFDANGQPMSPSFAYGRKGVAYRYYIAMDLQVGRRRAAGDDQVRRVNGEVLERFVRDELARLLARPELEITGLQDLVRRVDLGPSSTEIVLDTLILVGPKHAELALSDIRARLSDGEKLVWEDADRTALRLSLPIRFQMRGGRTWMDGARRSRTAPPPNPGMVRALKSAHRDLFALQSSPLTSLDDFQAAQAPDDQHRRQVSRLAFLAPDLQQALLEGGQPSTLKLRTLLKSELPLVWEDQRKWFVSLSNPKI